MIRFHAPAVLVQAGFAAAVAVSSAPASAAAVVYQGFTSSDCATTLTCVGSAGIAGTDLRLTPAQGSQAGAAYSRTPITLGSNATFSTTFLFQFKSPGGVDPADGIVFVISSQSTGLGSSGFGIGYAGATANSVGIEFDTFNNSQGYSNPGGTNDNSSNHVAIDVGGVLTNSQSTNPYGVANCTLANGHTGTGSDTYNLPGCMANGDVWAVTIGYDGAAKLLSIAVQDGNMAVQNLISNYPIDLATTLGTNAAYVGFTSGTGAGYEQHDILAWSFASDLTLVTPPAPPTTGVPEPAPVALLGLGIAALVAARRRRG